jgi:CheY-like chemotaxis protein
MHSRQLATRVLIADDERLIADTLVLILNHKGFQSSAVYSGEDAVEAATALQPDVVITDVVMGGMTGVEAAIHIRRNVPGCRVILFSGQAETVDLLRQAKDAGHTFELLSKPVHPQVILDHLHRVGCNPANGSTNERFPQN